jgi:hypothetical protein
MKNFVSTPHLVTSTTSTGTQTLTLVEDMLNMKLNYSKIEDVQVANIRMYDAPDFVDAFIESATYMGRPMTEQELEVLNSDSQFVYEQVEKRIYG